MKILTGKMKTSILIGVLILLLVGGFYFDLFISQPRALAVFYGAIALSIFTIETMWMLFILSLMKKASKKCKRKEHRQYEKYVFIFIAPLLIIAGIFMILGWILYGSLDHFRYVVEAFCLGIFLGIPLHVAASRISKLE